MLVRRDHLNATGTSLSSFDDSYQAMLREGRSSVAATVLFTCRCTRMSQLGIDSRESLLSHRTVRRDGQTIPLFAPSQLQFNLHEVT
jgi:hypothetical protein